MFLPLEAGRILWPSWPIQDGRSDAVWLQRLGHKIHLALFGFQSHSLTEEAQTDPSEDTIWRDCMQVFWLRAKSKPIAHVDHRTCMCREKVIGMTLYLATIRLQPREWPQASITQLSLVNLQNNYCLKIPSLGEIHCVAIIRTVIIVSFHLPKPQFICETMKSTLKDYYENWKIMDIKYLAHTCRIIIVQQIITYN